MNVERAEADRLVRASSGHGGLSGDDTPALIDEYMMLIHENVESIMLRHCDRGQCYDGFDYSEVVRASGGGAAAPVEQDGVISVPTKGSNGLYGAMKLASGLTTERGHSFVGIAIGMCNN